MPPTRNIYQQRRLGEVQVLVEMLKWVAREKEFTIRGIEDCVARGFERTGFFEIDTGEQSSWTVQLTEPVQQGTGGR